jgi:hypothetical protein
LKFLVDLYNREIFIKGESINFDPSLARACQNDIRQFCASRNPGNAQVIFRIKI